MREIIIKHLEAYEDKTGGLSFTKRNNIDYLAILALGQYAIPTLIDNIDFGWVVYSLLFEITKNNNIKTPVFPIEYSGKFDKVRNYWLNWGKDNGYM